MRLRAWFAQGFGAVLLAILLTGCGDKKPLLSESYVFGTRVEVQVA